MSGQEKKEFVCKKCGKEVRVLKEGENPSAPYCCGEEMQPKE